MANPISRRSFLSRAALAAAAPMVVPSHVLAGMGGKSPSDRIALGFIAVGGMGMGHLHSFLGTGRVQVVAIADPNEQSLDEARKHVAPDTAFYKDYRKLLERSDIDGVVISTPDHWHALPSIQACEAGKDVFCEKPLSLTIDEGRLMRDAARRYGRVFQTGSQQRCEPGFRFGCELVRNGYIGKVHTIKVGIGSGPTSGWEPPREPPEWLDWDLWLGPAPWAPYIPRRCHYNFRWFWDYSGGKMTDWGAHHLHIAQWALDMDESGPVHVEGKGTPPAGGLYETFTNFSVKYTYADGTEMTCGSHERFGTTFIGEHGEVYVSRGVVDANPKDLLRTSFGPNDIRLYDATYYSADPWRCNRENWLDCMWTRERPIADVEIGHRSVTVCHLGNLAMRLGRPINWDPAAERIVDDPEAARWTSKPYRAPWHL